MPSLWLQPCSITAGANPVDALCPPKLQSHFCHLPTCHQLSKCQWTRFSGSTKFRRDRWFISLLWCTGAENWFPPLEYTQISLPVVLAAGYCDESFRPWHRAETSIYPKPSELVILAVMFIAPTPEDPVGSCRTARGCILRRGLVMLRARRPSTRLSTSHSAFLSPYARTSSSLCRLKPRRPSTSRRSRLSRGRASRRTTRCSSTPPPTPPSRCSPDFVIA